MSRLPVDPRLADEHSVWPATKAGMGKLFRTTPDGYRLTISAIAARVGTTKDQIAKIQGGAQGMRLEMGLKVARALNRSPWWVLEYSKRAQAMAEAAGMRERLRASQRRRRARGRLGT